MKTIEIDEDVWNLLKKHAEPFIDTPNNVLRRLLGLDEKNNNAVRKFPPSKGLQELHDKTADYVKPAFLTFLIYKF